MLAVPHRWATVRTVPASFPRQRKQGPSVVWLFQSQGQGTGSPPISWQFSTLCTLINMFALCHLCTNACVKGHGGNYSPGPLRSHYVTQWAPSEGVRLALFKHFFFFFKLKSQQTFGLSLGQHHTFPSRPGRRVIKILLTKMLFTCPLVLCE